MYFFLSLSVIESHPDNAHDDLRLDRPFPSFVEFAKSFDLSAMTKQVSYDPIEGVRLLEERCISELSIEWYRLSKQ